MSLERQRPKGPEKKVEPKLGLGDKGIGIKGISILKGPEGNGTEMNDNAKPKEPTEKGTKQNREPTLLADLFPGKKEAGGDIDGKVVIIEKGKIV